ncbi:HdeD family acid-resistance protein [Streptomyces sp. NPDC059785]|uniref:HdeD family acid-resistance protein n=1 Tax=unclassified Streptomyces TaxID=2593676 RepID=UPI00364698CB
MTEVPNGSPRSPDFDDRRVHEARRTEGERVGPPEATAAPPAPPGHHPMDLLSRSAWQAVLATGIAALVLGIMILAWPKATLFAAGIIFGLYLVFSGVLQLTAAFGTHVATSLRVMAFISGVLSILLGLFCFKGAMQSILLLALWIGIGWLFRGITQTLAAVSDPQTPARGWQIFLGIISFLAGVVLIVSPFKSVAVLAVVTGIWLLAVGVVEIGTAIRIHKDGTRLAPRFL